MKDKIESPYSKTSRSSKKLLTTIEEDTTLTIDKFNYNQLTEFLFQRAETYEKTYGEKDTLLVESAEAIIGLYKEVKAQKVIYKQIISKLVDAQKSFHWHLTCDKLPTKTALDEDYRGYLIYENGYYEVADWTFDKHGCGPAFHVDGEKVILNEVERWIEIPSDRIKED